MRGDTKSLKLCKNRGRKQDAVRKIKDKRWLSMNKLLLQNDSFPEYEE